MKTVKEIQKQLEMLKKYRKKQFEKFGENGCNFFGEPVVPPIDEQISILEDAIKDPMFDAEELSEEMFNEHGDEQVMNDPILKARDGALEYIKGDTDDIIDKEDLE